MAPVSISTLYATPAVSLPVFTTTGYTFSPAILAQSLPVVPTASPRTLLTTTSVLTADIPELSHSIIITTTSNNCCTSSRSATSFDGSKWSNKQWVPVAAWALIIYDVAALFLLFWLWSVGMMDAMLNVSPSLYPPTFQLRFAIHWRTEWQNLLVPASTNTLPASAHPRSLP